MDLAGWSLRNRTITIVLTLGLLVGGIQAFNNLGRLEDPEFTIKDAQVSTEYPGATAREVEQEVTDKLEIAAQGLKQIKRIKSKSTRGQSLITVTIEDKYDKFGLPQVWDELRRKINDAQGQLPPGARTSIVNDDYGDVYGVYYAIYAENPEEYNYEDLRKVIDLLRRELLLCTDVAKIAMVGIIPEVVYVEMDRAKMAALGISPQQIYDALEGQNALADAGRVRVGGEWLPIDPTGRFSGVADIGNLLLNDGQSGRLIFLKDVARVWRGFQDPPDNLVYYDGKPAIGLAISTVPGGNVVTMGEAVDKRLAELQSQIPAGIRIGTISHQASSVNASVNGFVVSLLEAVVIVVAVLLLFMGLRCGLIIGFVLAVTIVGSFIFMDAMGILLERISLGALVIALGMLVDNAIVVTEGMLVRAQKGIDAKTAAREVSEQTMMPLLGATFIAILAFAAIGLSQNSAGEYCRSLFYVLGISLGLSWVTAFTTTPLLCYYFLKPSKKPAGEGEGDAEEDAYKGAVFQKYKAWLAFALRRRWATVGVAVVLLIAAQIAFKFVDPTFFPFSTRPQFMIDVWSVEGAHIEKTRETMARLEAAIEEWNQGIGEQEGTRGISSITSFAGTGGLRFLLTYSPENPTSAYGLFLVDVDDWRKIDDIMAGLNPYLAKRFPEVALQYRKFALGPGEANKIQARFRGPDPRVLRSLAEQAEVIMHETPGTVNIRNNWRNQVKVIVPEIKEDVARRAGISRREVSEALRVAYEGKAVSVYREADRLLPIIVRAPEEERGDVANMNFIQIWSPAAQRTIPLSQIVSGFGTAYENPIIERWERLPAITVYADAEDGLAEPLRQKLAERIDAIPLPEGYTLTWWGEYNDSAEAQESLFSSIPATVVLMILITIFLYNAIRQPLIIWLTVPLAIIGVAFGLLFTGLPFTFVALLGLLSLSGMLIKNSIVLIDEIDLQIDSGKERFEAVLDACVSRLRPVAMAASTTVLGMVPLVFDPFFASMAVAIMAGLTFATLLTMFLVPTFYVILFRIPAPAAEKEAGA